MEKCVRWDAGDRSVPTCVTAGAMREAVTLSPDIVIVKRDIQDHDVIKSVLMASMARVAITDASVKMMQPVSMWAEPVLVYQAGLEHTVKNPVLKVFTV